MTLGFEAAGAALLYRHLPESMVPEGGRLFSAAFQSVSARTAGFNTVDVAGLAPAALFVIILLMWIGGSPASTAGGVKTTTVAVALLTVLSIAGGKGRVELFRRRLGDSSIQRAFATVIVSVFLLSASVLALLAFEAVSALSTVGLSTGVTPTLGTPSKLLLSGLMLAGRVGLLGCVLAVTPRGRNGRHEYAREDVLVT